MLLCNRIITIPATADSHRYGSVRLAAPTGRTAAGGVSCHIHHGRQLACSAAESEDEDAGPAKMSGKSAMDPSVTAKQDVAHLLAQLPDDATLRDIQYRVYVLGKIRCGRTDVAEGRHYTREQARERLAR